MPDYILKRPSECADEEACFATPDDYEHPRLYASRGQLVVRGGSWATVADLLNLACDFRDRAERAEAELAKKGARLQNSERKRRIAVKQCQNLERKIAATEAIAQRHWQTVIGKQRFLDKLAERCQQLEADLAQLRRAVAWKTGMAGTPDQVAARVCVQYAESLAEKAKETAGDATS